MERRLVQGGRFACSCCAGYQEPHHSQRMPRPRYRSRVRFYSGDHLSILRPTLAVGVLLMAWAMPATAQRAAIQPDSARAQIRVVLRAFYVNLESQN